MREQKRSRWRTEETPEGESKREKVTTVADTQDRKVFGRRLSHERKYMAGTQLAVGSGVEHNKVWAKPVV